MACRKEDLVRLSPLEYSTVVWWSYPRQTGHDKIAPK